MTKAELQKDRDEWKEEAESLQDELAHSMKLMRS